MEGYYLNQMYIFFPCSSQSKPLLCLDKKCDLALRVSVNSGSVKLPETGPGLPSPPHLHLHTSFALFGKTRSLWALAYFI